MTDIEKILDKCTEWRWGWMSVDENERLLPVIKELCSIIEEQRKEIEISVRILRTDRLTGVDSREAIEKFLIENSDTVSDRLAKISGA